MAQIEQGNVVWAKGPDGIERRYRVIWVEGAVLTLKDRGNDAGTFTRPAANCLKSDRQPSTLTED